MNLKAKLTRLLVCVPIAFAGLPSCAHGLQTTGLPDPLAPSPTEVIPVMSPSGGSRPVQDLPGPGVARDKAGEAVQSIRTIAARAVYDLQQIQSLNADLQSQDGKLSALIDAKNRALAELRQGLYCSQCHRTKTEIEQTGENFWDHLKRVNGTPIPAPQSEIDAKAKEYDQQIANLSAQIEQQKNQDRAQIAKLQAEARDAWGQIQQGIYMWEMATTFERDLIVANENQDKQHAQAAIDFASQRLRAAEAGRDTLMKQGAEPSAIDAADMACKVWQQSKDQAEKDAANRWSAFVPDLKSADENKTKDYVQITTALSPITANPYFSGLSGLVPNFSITINQVSLSVSPTMLGVSFRFGKLFSGGVSAGEVDAATTEARSFIDFMGKVRASAIWRTEYTDNGVLNYPTSEITPLPLQSAPNPSPSPSPQPQIETGLPLP